VNAPGVEQDVSKQGPGVPKGNVSASPVAESSIIVLTATSRKQADAVTLAQRYAQGLQSYVSDLNGATADTNQLLTDYTQASQDLANATATAAKAPSGSAAAADAAAAVSAAKLKSDGLAASYQQRLQAGTGSGSVTIVAPAVASGSDRKSTTEKLVAIGVVAGLLIGSGWAMAAEHRQRRRRTNRGTAAVATSSS
jgi:capsular polysaccharide biosynthesis protein